MALFLLFLPLLLFILFKASVALLCFKCADEHLIVVVATSASGRVDGGIWEGVGAVGALLFAAFFGALY